MNIIPTRIIRITTILATTAAVAFAAIGGSAASAQSVATTTAPNVRSCFYYASDGTAVSNAPVVLYEAAPGATSWTKVRSGTTSSNGCTTFVGVHRGYRYHAMLHKVIGNSNVGMAVLDGSTNVGTTGSTGTLTVSGWVYIRCIPGLYGSIC